MVREREERTLKSEYYEEKVSERTYTHKDYEGGKVNKCIVQKYAIRRNTRMRVKYPPGP